MTMAMPSRLNTVGEHERPDHSHLPAGSTCYFWGEYTPKEHTNGSPWSFSPTNQLIFNFKKKLNSPGQHYKKDAINQVVRAYMTIYDWDALSRRGIALVPIPPSKARTDPLFDPRMHEVLTGIARSVGGALDIRDCLSFSGAYGASHEVAVRPTPEDLYRELAFDRVTGRVEDPPSLIILFDDMLTTGAHFVAATRRLSEAFPSVEVFGSFIARRVLPNPFVDFEDLTAP